MIRRFLQTHHSVEHGMLQIPFYRSSPQLHQPWNRTTPFHPMYFSSIVTKYTRNKFAKEKEPPSFHLYHISKPFKIKNEPFLRFFGSRMPTVRGKAVKRYRDPFDDTMPNPNDRRYKPPPPVEEKPSINLKNWDVNSYKGWDAVDDAEVVPPPKIDPDQNYPSTTSRLTKQVIYDGRASLQDLEKAKAKKKARRAAQDKPFHKLCRTCVVCKRQFRGHGSMLMHLMNSKKCYDHLEPEIQAGLNSYKDQRHDKSDRARMRKKGVVFTDADVEPDFVAPTITTSDDKDDEEEDSEKLLTELREDKGVSI